ncbi:uncharacterized protein LOC109849577 isoform X4 [Asparagus officinalis]|uniref:uncharacterized protein LOC109849577 isoform X4 n=1 Tax=Asparagus officinalis TaxID=4686 RepID=UPI00098E1628|nr:uncharacterized protein LOC109849577 isoform X4 [Asparagus officinalis]
MSSSRFLQDLYSIQSIFFNIVRWKVGNGNSGSFWHDKWSSDNSLSSLYPHAYKLALSKNCSISSQGRWTNNSWIWHPLIRRGISPNEREDILHLLSHLENKSPGASSDHDGLQWPLLSSGPADDRTARRLRRASLNLGLQELAKKNTSSGAGDNSAS